jgi:hypothetical protein
MGQGSETSGEDVDDSVVANVQVSFEYSNEYGLQNWCRSRYPVVANQTIVQEVWSETRF